MDDNGKAYWSATLGLTYQNSGDMVPGVLRRRNSFADALNSTAWGPAGFLVCPSGIDLCFWR